MSLAWPPLPMPHTPMCWIDDNQQGVVGLLTQVLVGGQPKHFYAPLERIVSVERHLAKTRRVRECKAFKARRRNHQSKSKDEIIVIAGVEALVGTFSDIAINRAKHVKHEALSYVSVTARDNMGHPDVLHAAISTQEHQVQFYLDILD